jgi:hypothetical protein
MSRDTLDKLRPAVVRHLQHIPAPSSVGEIMNKLHEELEEGGCTCKSCIIHQAQAAETIVIIEEALKMTPEDSENGLAGLIYRMHLSRESAIVDIVEAEIEKKVKRALLQKLVGSLMGGRDNPLSAILGGPPSDGPNIQDLPPGLGGILMRGDPDEEPPPGFMALEGDDAMAFIKSVMGGEEMPEELRAKLDKMAAEAKEREEETEEATSEVP